MFTHPALLRELNLTAEQLRRCGEARWAQKLVLVADGLRKTGWTAAGLALMRELEQGRPGFHEVRFGDEHRRLLGGDAGVAQANEGLQRHRLRLAELIAWPTRELPAPGPRLKSPDLEP